MPDDHWTGVAPVIIPLPEIGVFLTACLLPAAHFLRFAIPAAALLASADGRDASAGMAVGHAQRARMN